MILSQYLSAWVIETSTERLSVHHRRTDISFPQGKQNQEGWLKSQRHREDCGEVCRPFLCEAKLEAGATVERGGWVAAEGRASPAPTGELLERRFAVESRGCSQFFLDAQQLVIFRDAVGARSRAGLDLSAARSHHQVGDKGILGFT